MEGVRTHEWKYVRYFDRAKDTHYSQMINASIDGEQPVYEELFNLENDPLEINNVIAKPENAATANELRRMNTLLVKQFRGTGPLNTHPD